MCTVSQGRALGRVGVPCLQVEVLAALALSQQRPLCAGGDGHVVTASADTDVLVGPANELHCHCVCVLGVCVRVCAFVGVFVSRGQGGDRRVLDRALALYTKPRQYRGEVATAKDFW